MGGATGLLSGSIDRQTGRGTINFVTQDTIVKDVVPVTGSLSDGSSYKAYLAGIPGSWQGLFTGLAKQGETLSILQGSLDDPSYTGSGALNASGPLMRYNVGVATGTITEQTVSFPVLKSISPEGGYTFALGEQSVSGYPTATGSLGITSWQTVGSYGKPVGSGTEWTAWVGKVDLAGNTAFLGQVLVTDDGAGHVRVSTVNPLTYMTSTYLDTIGFESRGVYAGTGTENYNNVGTAVVNLTPLKYRGYWGETPESLYTNDNGKMKWVGHEEGLLGGITAVPWGSAHMADLQVLGRYTYGTGITTAPEAIMKSAVTGEAADASGHFTGEVAGLWGEGKNASLRALYWAPKGASDTYEVGILTSDAITLKLYDTLSMWSGTGTLSNVKSETLSGFSARSAPSVYTDENSPSLYLAGVFSGAPGSSIRGAMTAYSPTPTDQTESWTPAITWSGFTDASGTRLPWGAYTLTLTQGSFTGKPEADTTWSGKIGAPTH